MKLVELKCKNCGAILKADENEKNITCQFCQTKFKLDDEVQHIKYDDMEQSGYDFEKGRLRAQHEHKTNNENQINSNEQNNNQQNNNKKTLWKVLAWIFLFPFMLTYYIIKSDKLDKKKKIIILAVFWILFFIIGSTNSEKNIENNEKNKVTIIDFTTMTKEEINNWCTNNKVKCTFVKKYSDTIEKDKTISQSIEADKVVDEGKRIIITFSLGKEPSIGQKNALKKAEIYSDTMHMSKSAIYKQLTSEYGEGFTKEEAQYAIDNIEANWKENALAKAKIYQKDMSMSSSAIYKQLISEYGEGFTKEEAQYAVDHLED